MWIWLIRFENNNCFLNNNSNTRSHRHCHQNSRNSHVGCVAVFSNTISDSDKIGCKKEPVSYSSTTGEMQTEFHSIRPIQTFRQIPTNVLRRLHVEVKAILHFRWTVDASNGSLPNPTRRDDGSCDFPSARQVRRWRDMRESRIQSSACLKGKKIKLRLKFIVTLTIFWLDDWQQFHSSLFFLYPINFSFKSLCIRRKLKVEKNFPSLEGWRKGNKDNLGKWKFLLHISNVVVRLFFNGWPFQEMGLQQRRMETKVDELWSIKRQVSLQCGTSSRGQGLLPCPVCDQEIWIPFISCFLTAVAHLILTVHHLQ